MQIVIFPFSDVPTSVLENVAEHVLPPKLKRKSGKSELRIRSYYAGRCALAWIFSRLGAAYFVAPNHEYGYLELFDANGHKINTAFVNLSHTESIVVAAFSTTPVGIDIEKKNRSAMRVIPRVMTKEEKQWIKEVPQLPKSETGTDIFLWSAKEAFSKALGLGMKFGFKAFEITSREESVFVAHTKIKGPLQVLNPGIYHCTYEEYFISLCAEHQALLAGIDRHIIDGRELGILRDKLNRAKEEKR